MIEMRMKDGTVFDPVTADWRIRLKNNPEVDYTFADIALIMMIEPVYDVVQGLFGPPGTKGMPIRGVKFTDLSDLAVEVPMPLDAAREMGEILAKSDIEIAQAVPTSLMLAERVAQASKKHRR